MKKIKLVGLGLVASLSLAAPAVLAGVSGLDYTPAIVQAQEDGTVLKVAYLAAHGDRSFTSVAVLVKGDVIVDAYLDEYQYSEGYEGVPNSDASFGEAFPEGLVLASKKVNSEAYSASMAEKAGSTVAYDENLAAIEDSVKGKTFEEVEALIGELDALGEDGNVSDVVSGATLADASGYVGAILEAAKTGMEFPAAATEAADLEIKQVLAAPHGDKSFALVNVVLDGDVIVAASLDEFQFVEGDQWTGVPNSDAAFGENYPEGSTLVSKLVDSEGYSAMMSEIAGSTVSYYDNLQAVVASAVGKTTEEISATIEELNGLGEDGNVADVVSGATLADAAGYLQAILDAAAN
ncbi:peptidoglycan-binding protein [Fundicoccus ignavus]|uniref:Peptidoglycan-binding protein n=1 Tax=Fundicoccus ignavus TaxID=2664442 RepID=A0A844C1X3_9LACT|nr:peptidoglycan-binding protein [Fundicoccus ignavus]MRJ47122.1 peptidoglycan-binding protein [Fundicoccus ignavus]